jgi:hypothetical protein
MTNAELKFKEHSIVLLGTFNPVIFNPHWLARKGLIGNELADAAQTNVNSTEVSEFILESFKILVLTDRFIASSVQEMHFDNMRDLTVGIFEYLPECPIVKIGINYHHHYAFNSEEDYIEFGHKIVPKDPLWNALMPEPGVANISIQSPRQDDYVGKRVATVKVSNKVQYGVEIHVNDHYDLYKVGEENSVDASRAVQVVKEQWETSIEGSTNVIKGVFEYGCNSAS